MLAKKCDRCGGLYEHYDGKKAFPKSQSNSLELRDTDLKEAFWQRDRFGTGIPVWKSSYLPKK